MWSLFLLLPPNFLFVRTLQAPTKRYTRFQRVPLTSIETLRQVQEIHEPSSSVANFLSSDPPRCRSDHHKLDLLTTTSKISHCSNFKLPAVADSIYPHTSLLGVFFVYWFMPEGLVPTSLFVPLINIRKKKKKWSFGLMLCLPSLNKTRNTKDAILACPKQDFLLHTNTTHPPTVEEITKLGLQSLPHWFLIEVSQYQN